MKLHTLTTIIVGFLLACHAGEGSDFSFRTDSREGFCFPSEVFSRVKTQNDKQIFKKVIEKINSDTTDFTDLSDVLTKTGIFFLETPYVAYTLEIPGDEQLVVNLREMDCTTFVEYVVALTLLIKENRTDFERFTQLLACIRYRDGIIDGYPSRLHYFTEWLQNNADKGILEIVSNQVSDVPYDTRVSFMSSNPGLYRQLENPEYVSSIKETEKVISGFEMNFIPKDRIPEIEDQIKDGDIIAFTTNITGLDVSHTGFAIHQNGRLHLLHASTRTNQVEISPVPLSDYLAPMRRVTGILVGRISLP
ncbi:MAG: DUF1460 domain-containing protein [Bacteroidetes bacterium]|nr:MAG: DUF1460 domain-containing protein [Bacteroidota bacterium]